ncbi:hypothetical protein ASC68_19085 [Devosia sp. Root105]|nr:hypothetical protein ASC68_19085 [Devosia sp. Root105]
MPIRATETARGSHVFERRCDGCGAPHAPYGKGSLREAIRTGEFGRLRCWCGPAGCRAPRGGAP